MKKLLFITLLFPLITIAQDKVSVLLESNINYAPLGIKVIIQNDSTKIGGYITFKLSENVFFRNVNKDKQAIDYNENATTTDINEILIGGGIAAKITNNVDFYGGLGIMTGDRYVLSYYRYNNQTYPSDYWLRTNNTVLFPMASFGVILTINRLKFSIGNEIAFTKDSQYMASVPNQKSFARLSSATFGIGYSFW